MQFSRCCKRQPTIYPLFQSVYPLCPYVTAHVSVHLWPDQIYQNQCTVLRSPSNLTHFRTPPELSVFLICVFNSRSAIHLLTMVLDWVTSPLNTEDKTQSSGMVGMGSVWLGALWLWKSECRKWWIRTKGKCLLTHRFGRLGAFKRTRFAHFAYCIKSLLLLTDGAWIKFSFTNLKNNGFTACNRDINHYMLLLSLQRLIPMSLS